MQNSRDKQVKGVGFVNAGDQVYLNKDSINRQITALERTTCTNTPCEEDCILITRQALNLPD
jgi:hypothetical protein